MGQASFLSIQLGLVQKVSLCQAPVASQGHLFVKLNRLRLQETHRLMRWGRGGRCVSSQASSAWGAPGRPRPPWSPRRPTGWADKLSRESCPSTFFLSTLPSHKGCGPIPSLPVAAHWALASMMHCGLESCTAAAVLAKANICKGKGLGCSGRLRRCRGNHSHFHQRLLGRQDANVCSIVSLRSKEPSRGPERELCLQ